MGKMRDSMSAQEYEDFQSDIRAMSNSKSLHLLFDDLRAEYLEKLIQADVNSLTAATLHASIKVLADIEGRLKSYRNDGLFKPRGNTNVTR